MESPINFELIAHPMNWVTIFLMVFIAGILLHLILVWESGPKTSGTSS